MQLGIHVYPDPVLRRESAPIEVIDPELRSFAEDMTGTMYTSDGVGLAAPQVGVNKRLIVVDVSGEHNDPQVLINPEIVDRSGRQTGEEGCLSLPGLHAEISRATTVTVVAQLLTGEEVEIRGEGLAARALQHEIDHLDGILFIDRAGTVDRFRLRDELKRMEEDFARRAPA